MRREVEPLGTDGGAVETAWTGPTVAAVAAVADGGVGSPDDGWGSGRPRMSTRDEITPRCCHIPASTNATPMDSERQTDRPTNKSTKIETDRQTGRDVDS